MKRRNQSISHQSATSLVMSRALRKERGGGGNSRPPREAGARGLSAHLQPGVVIVSGRRDGCAGVVCIYE